MKNIEAGYSNTYLDVIKIKQFVCKFPQVNTPVVL